MGEVIYPNFSKPQIYPDRLVATLRNALGTIKQMPEVLIHWDMSEGKKLLDHQAAAYTSQLLAGVPQVIDAAESFAAKNPGKPIGPYDMCDDYWLVFHLAVRGAVAFEWERQNPKPLPGLGG